MRRVALFVMGCPRSGTSALTRVLSLCGGTLPPGLLGASSANPTGYWEPRAAVNLNHSILHRRGINWLDPSVRDGGAVDWRAIADVGAYLSALPASPLTVIKELQITVLSDVWFEAARLAGFEPVAVIAVRHPQEVAASLAAVCDVSPQLSAALWLKHNLLAERNTRGMPRVVVDYANLLDDWRREVKRIAAALPVDLVAEDEGPVDEFLTPDLHRQRHGGPVTSPFGTHWVCDVHDELCTAARDESWNQSALDRVFDEYRASETGFRAVFEDSRHYQDVSRLIPPPLKNLMMGVRAAVNRRSGTWA